MLVEEEDMKKFALGILSVFMILGGVLLSACDKKVSLSVSTEEVVIYTNYDKEGYYQSKTIDVSLKNSSDGVRVEILKGGDSIRLSSVKKKTTENYSFTIYGDKSGEAEVRVSSIEDNKQNAIINVKVNTVLEYLERLPDDTVDARTNKFAVKGVEKELNVDDYFKITPVTANIKDIEWSFVDEVVSGAQIVDGNKLLVSEDFTGSYIDLKASFTRNKEKNGIVRFEVLDNSTINSFVLGEENIYTNGTLVSNDDITFDLVRNNANASFVNGVIEFNTSYEVNLDLDVYQKESSGNFKKLSQDDYEEYFLFNVLRKQTNETTKKVTYTFQIESLDSSSVNKFGDFYFVLKAGYKNYNFNISTYDMSSKNGASIVLKTLYSATRVELLNDGNDVINDSTINVFSNYTTGNGYKIKVSVLPDEVAVDNDYVYISINKQELVGLDLPTTNPIASLAKFYYRGSEILFELDANNPQYYKSTTMVKAGTEVYVSSVKNCDTPVKFVFSSASKHAQSVSTSLTMNLYQITTGEKLEISKFDGGQLDEVSYLSSSQSSTRTKTFEMRVKGISTLAGLSLKTDSNSKFDFSGLTLVPNEDGDDENSVKIQFTVTLKGSNFDDSSKFWLEHVTGKKSEVFTVSAFVPLTSASVKNGDKSSSNVYADIESNQGFTLEETGIKNYGTIVDSSVSKLMLEAGTILPLNINYRNASLSARGVYYKYLAYSDLFDALKNTGVTEEATAEFIKNMIASKNAGIENYYQYFDLKDGMAFSISDGRLVLTDNAFKGFVCVLFAGYNEEHKEVTLARFFYLESLYSVRFLSSNVKTTLLYTTETLSLADIDRSNTNVTISMRADEKVPTYSNNLQYFSFSSAVMDFQVNESRDYWYNDYYEISDIAFTSSGRYLKFKLTANSTKLQTSVKDILTVSYRDENGFARETEIQIEIKNERRIESVQWLNRTEDDEIYLNLTTTVTSERSFTISTSVYPSEANDLGLSHIYFATAGTANDLSITTSSSGQTFNLNINTTTGSYGNLFLLPNDMVKIIDGVRQVLLYKYTEDANGNIIETPIYKKLSELYLYYDNMIEEGDEFSTYFYNNDGEKVYYKDTIIKISVIIADGMSEGTAIRIYNEGDLLNIDTAKYYKIMNNLTLNNWKSYDRFGGMIFGKDESVSLKFEGNSENFVGTLSGTIKNLTFAGNVTVPDTNIQTGGFVANENNGLIENVVVDVYYGEDTYVDTNGVTQKYKRYMPSMVNSIARYVGGVAGRNNGTINNAYVYGLSIVSNYTGGDANYTGGIAGYNAGKISGSGVEFYNFSKKENENTEITVKNIFKANGSIGGIAGFGGDKSSIEKSYAYAYSLNDSTKAQITQIFENGSISKGAFFAEMSSGAIVKESFAFMGNLIAPFVSATSVNTATFINSYITYFRNNALQTRIFKDANFSYANEIYSGTGIVDDYVLFANADLPTDYADSTTYSAKWKKLVSGDAKLDSTIWELSNIDTNINFGFMYLKNVIQSASVNIENISLADNTEPLKSLNAGKDATTGVEKGILFVYETTAIPSTSAEQSALLRYNTISIADLFGVTQKQARSLLVSTDSKNVSISSTSIRLLSKNTNKFALSVHSKMDFTNSKTFEVVVLNYLPELKTTINQSEIKQGRTILLQTGTNNSQTIMYNTNSTIYLNGNAYLTRKDSFAIEYNLKTANGQDLTSDEHISISKNSNSLNLIGDKAHDGDDYTALNSYLVVADIANDAEYSATIKNARRRDFKVSVYNGATALVIDNASSLVVKPSQYAVFDVTLDTDYNNDDLVFSLKYDQVGVDLQKLSENSIRFAVDSKLSVDLSWTKTKITETRYSFKVWVKISEENKHLIDKDYDNLTLTINAQSQSANSKYAKTLALTVRTQEIEDIGIASYNIESRQFVRSVLYYKMADEITNTLVPSSDAIVAVSINPAYAKMTHFTLTYTVSGASVGTVSLSRLKFNERYGYYVDTSSTTLITNGIQVNLLEEDKTGNGMFYFRMYISSSFASNSELKLTLTCYDGNSVLTAGTHSLNVNYLQEARVRVNGASTYILAKGDHATVQVVTALDQELSDLYLKNNYANISLTQPTVEVFDNYKLYTATLIAYVDAKLQNNMDSGIFYVCATVQRAINNRLEIKESKATICLVDFSVDGSKIAISANAGKTTYNGKSYDTFYSYVNATDTIAFDYPMSPATYTYDANDVNEVAAVEKLIKSRDEFALNNYYKDGNVGYYINCAYNEKTGVYDEIELKRQLWYATDEENSTSICNNSEIIQKDIFRIDEVEYKDRTGKYLTLTGKRTGRQLMKLKTTILYQGIEFSYDYYFLVVVDLWTDEESPTQIFTADEFIKYATESEKAGDYILMNDIVLNDYTPLDTDLIKSLDGNGYTIHINSFAMPERDTSLQLALFNSVDEDSTLKNIRVNLYNGGQIAVNVSQYNNINIAGFAIENNGVIYNCEVVSYYDENYQPSATSGDTGLVVKYMLGNNTDPINLTAAMVSAMSIESKVSGFVSQNNASIMNSRVGGESIRQILNVAETRYIKSQKLGKFVIEGQGEVVGFVNSNSSSAYISASFADNVQIYNNMAATTSITAGFVGYNNNKIQNSYVEGRREGAVTSDNANVYNNLTNITSIGIIAGFVYENNALIKNSYANIAIENSLSKASLVAGFVYKNERDGEIKLCYAACEITKSDINQMLFSGVDDFANSLNNGKISFSYYFNGTRDETTSQSKVTSGALAVTDIGKQDTFYGFSFATDSESYNGIWEISDNGITLVSPDKIAFSNRYGVTNTSGVTTIFYNKTLLDADTMRRVDLSYGSENNPIIIRNAYDFAVATGKATTKEISSYKEYYSDAEVNGNYRLVNNIDMSEIDQNAENDNSIKLTTTSKTFTGLLDGNGFTISNINLGSSVVTENYGLFAKLDGANIMNLDLVVDSIHNSQANIVGTLAGTAVNSRILAITLSPVDSQSTSVQKTSILGNNIVGGVVGMMFGESGLSDIQVKDIDIYSSYYKRDKVVGENDANVGQKLRMNIQNKASIYSYVSKVSYAGGIAGYVDIYNTISSEYVKYSNTLEVSDYDIITVHVSDAVNIYGEVSGGLFGYVGNSTYIYDANIELDADMNLTKPSYIISKNLYAGGLVGENYGGLFAVSANYADALQKTIEENENGYYSGSLSAEKGQQSIFSYTPNDEGYISNINAPLYVGGLVGFMGGGYVYIGYNKLNVISHSSSTLAVGGIVGLAGYTANLFDLNFVTNAPKVNILLNDVYASGDVFVDGKDENGKIAGDAAGIIGALQSVEGKVSIVGLKDAVAVNYYSYNGFQFIGDDAVADNSGYVSDHHHILVGKIYSNDKKEVKTLNSALYLIDSDDNYINMAKSTETTSVGSLTVGGYNSVVVGSTKLDLLPFGFDMSWKPECEIGDDKYNAYVKSIFDGILRVNSIGDSSMSTMSAAYAKMYTYFLSNGWSDKFWNHEEEHLFPDIQLLSKSNMIYWDVYNTQEVLQKMQNSGVTVVVRGRVSNDDVNVQYSDIDLTKTSVTKEDYNLISGFKGTLISYYDYMNSEDAGFVTLEVTDDSTKRVIGGHKANGNTPADKVGIILNKSLFRSIDSDVLIQGINFYYQKNTDNKNYMLVDGGLSSTVFRDVNIVVNDTIDLETVQFDTDFYTTGLVAKTAYASSFINMGVKLRYGAQITISHEAECKDVYIGLLSGYMQQTSSSKQMAVQGINIEREPKEGETTDVNFDIKIKTGVVSNTIYAGLYAGAILKGNGNCAKVGVGLTNPGKVRLNVKIVGEDKKGNEITKNYEEVALVIGGFVGKIDAVDNVVTLNNTETADKVSNLSILLNSGVKTLQAGLGFGVIENSSLTIANESGVDSKLVGGIYQVGDIVCGTAQLGGLAGKLNSETEIQGYSVDFSVGKLVEKTENGTTTYEAPTYKVEEGDDKSPLIFEKNLYDYSDMLHPFIVKGGLEDSIGGFYGMASGGAVVSIIGTCEISGNIDVKVSATSNTGVATLSVGGIVGQIAGRFVSSASIKNSLNVSVDNSKNENNTSLSAYVGGMIGKVATHSGARIDINYTSGKGYNVYYTGDVLSSSVDELVFGGAIGYVEQDKDANYQSTVENVKISKVIYGGSVKVYGTFKGKKITAGGVVGEYLLPTSGGTNVNKQSLITKCFSFGDVFVNYKGNDESDDKLEAYKFGGIVGVASYIEIQECTSIMTSFNSRETNQSVGYENIGAIVGANSDRVAYENNYYSSGVNLAYQEEIGNTDIAYTEVSGTAYSGYTSVTKKSNGDEISLESKENALNLATTKYMVSNSGEHAFGHKLNPYQYTNSDKEKKINVDIKLPGNSHNISWVSLSQDLNGDNSINDVIADNLTNVAFVGNGRIITRDDNEGKISITDKDNADLGALVNNIGKDTDDNNKDPNFNIISGLVMDLNINTTDLTAPSNYAPTFGGVVGRVSGNSFVYGVGVKGNLSIGGTGFPLQLAGLVGTLHSGLIDQCYVDADITYRAGEKDGSSIAGAVAFVHGDYNSIIRSTYTSGRLETYADIGMYTFARRGNASKEGVSRANWIIDCYSISQIKRNNALNSNEFTKEIVFSSVFKSESGQGFSSNGIIINGCYDTINNCYDTINDCYGTSKQDNVTKVTNIDEVALAYNQYDDICSSIDANSPEQFGLNDEGKRKSINRWYFNPYVNYGYASHGFGWLKNVSTYTRSEKTNKDSNYDTETGNTTEAKTVISNYEYNPVTYSDIISFGNDYGKGWFLGVLNQGKFNQMLDTVASDNTPSYEKAYRFVLRYDFKVSKVGLNIGKDNSFVLDGNNTTIDLASKGSNIGLFNEVYGTIENLRITNANINQSIDANKTSVGILAGTVNGKLNNITVSGQIVPTGGDNLYIGGIVGKLTGDGIGLTSTAYIQSDLEKVIIGGVAGFVKSGSISYASNAGIVIEDNSGVAPIADVTIKNLKKSIHSSETRDIKVSHLAGGVVGRAVGTSISNSYNANSVLVGYTISSKLANTFVAGGIVGFAEGTTIENCYNTGLVGAGNYSSNLTKDGYATFAGGIVGYAYADDKTKENKEYLITGCMNDGVVQALGKHLDGSKQENYEIQIERESGEEEMTGYKKQNIEPLVYNVKMTYNKGYARSVYAYGIGYTENGTIDSSCDSSTDNIKNDGNIGEYVYETKLIFDRQGTLDNENGTYNHWGKFVVDKVKSDINYTISGYDAYGFPARIYVKDTISRTYGDPSSIKTNDKYNNEIIGQEREVISGKNQLRSYGGVYSYDGNTWQRQGDAKVEKASTSAFNGWNEEAYYMKVDTQYYQSARFVGYENVLNFKGNITSVGFDNNGSISGQKANDVISSLVDDGIVAIDGNRQQTGNFESTTINGMKTAVVYNSTNFRTAYMPFSYTLKASFVDNTGVIDINNLSKKNFTLGNISDNIEPQYTDMKFETEENASGQKVINVTATVFFAEALSTTAVGNITMTYKSVEIPVDLGRDNIEDGDYRGIFLYYIDETSSMDFSFIKDNKDSYEFTVQVGTGDDLSNYETLSPSDYDIKSNTNLEGKYISYTGSHDVNYFKNKKLAISYIYTFDVEIEAKNNLKIEKNMLSEIDLSNPFVKKTTRFTDYQKVDIAGSGYFDDVYADQEVNGNQGIFVNLNALTNDFKGYSKFVFGNSDYNISYKAGAYTVSSTKNNCIAAEINGLQGLLFVGMSDTTELKNITSTFELYHSKKEITADMTGISKTLKSGYTTIGNGLTFCRIGELQPNGKYNIDGKYAGTHSEFKSEANEILFFGESFYEKEVEYSYALREIDLKNESTNNYGYNIEFYKGENDICYYTVGALLSGQTNEFNGEFIKEAATFNIQTFTTTKSATGVDNYNPDNDTYKAERTITFKSPNDENVEYSIQKTTYKCPIHSTGTTSTPEGVIITTMVNPGQLTNSSYYYYVFDCGAIMVDYVIFGSGNESKQEQASRRFVVDKDLAARNKMLECRKDSTPKQMDGGKYYDWKNEYNEVALNWAYFNSQYEAQWDTGITYTKTIKIDVIASYIDEKQVLFAKNEFETPLNDVDTYRKTYDHSEVKYPTNPLITLYKGLQQTKDFGANIVSGSLQYRPAEGSEWTTVAGTSIKETEFGIHKYMAKYSATMTSDSAQFVSVSKGKEVNYEYLIIARDINLGELSVAINDKTIIGNGNNLTFVQSSSTNISLFKTNKKMIRDINIIGITNLREGKNNNNYGLFINKNLASLINVEIYGVVRNITNNKINVNSNVYNSTVQNNAVISIKSYVTMVGLDGQKQNVLSVLNEYLDVTNTPASKSFESFDIVIAGNGYNGQGGLDGDQRLYYLRNGAAGEDGGNGGNIFVDNANYTNVDYFKGYARVGAAGAPGYGGNGKNGKYQSGFVYGGGAGGKVGKQGNAGAIKTRPSQDSSQDIEIKQSLTTGEYNSDNIAGNGGIGAFGRIIGNLYYSSTAGGDSGDVDKPSSGGNVRYAYVWKNDSNKTFGFGRQFKDLASSHHYPTGAQIWWENWENDWTGNIDKSVKANNVRPQQISGNGTEEKYGKGVTMSKVYVSIQVRWERTWFTLGIGVNIYENKTVVWTSGECLNGAGACGWATT